MRSSIVPPLLLAFLCVLPAHSQAAPGGADFGFVRDRCDADSMIGKRLPDLVLHSSDGDTLDLKSLREHPVLLNFWAVWCGQCTIGIQNAARLSAFLPPGFVSLRVNIPPPLSRPPGEAPQAYLARMHFSIPTFEDDHRSLQMALHLTGQLPPPISVLIDADGRIVFLESAVFQKELESAIEKLLPGTQIPPATEAGALRVVGSGSDSTSEIRSLALQAVQNQSTYVEGQERYVCRYQIVTRDQYGSGRSQHQVQHIEDVMASSGHSLESRFADVGDALDPNPVVASISFAVWADPIFTAVLQHSILSDLSQTQPGFVTFTFRGDPAYEPVSDTERIAQSLEGTVVLDLTRHIFVQISGRSAYDVIDKNRFLMKRGIPILEFHAAPFQGAYLPSEWEPATYGVVKNGPRAEAAWLATLQRSFGTRESCQVFRPDSEVLPGFTVVPQQK